LAWDNCPGSYSTPPIIRRTPAPAPLARNPDPSRSGTFSASVRIFQVREPAPTTNKQVKARPAQPARPPRTASPAVSHIRAAAPAKDSFRPAILSRVRPDCRDAYFARYSRASGDREPARWAWADWVFARNRCTVLATDSLETESTSPASR